MVKGYLIIIGLLSIMLLMLTGCSTEQTYRSVPETTWNQLTSEQKQLIVDRSFQDEMQKE